VCGGRPCQVSSHVACACCPQPKLPSDAEILSTWHAIDLMLWICTGSGWVLEGGLSLFVLHLPIIRQPHRCDSHVEGPHCSTLALLPH
jgi:hypothetical protein